MKYEKSPKYGRTDKVELKASEKKLAEQLIESLAAPSIPRSTATSTGQHA